MTRRSGKQPAAAKKPKPSAQQKKHTEDLLDEALEQETFPASDPVAMIEPMPNSKRPGNKKIA